MLWIYHKYVCARSFQSYLTLCDSMDYSPLGSSVHGILQARILEWVAMPSSKVSSPLRNRTRVSSFLHWQAGFLPPAPPGKSIYITEVESKGYTSGWFRLFERMKGIKSWEIIGCQVIWGECAGGREINKGKIKSSVLDVYLIYVRHHL